MNRAALSIGLVCCAALSWGHDATARDAAGLTFVSTFSDPAHERVLDIREPSVCAEASLPGARCVPVNAFKSSTGRVIGFHALRWLLGTVGLSGEETVLVVGADGADTRMVGALLYLAGQRRVQMFDKAFAHSPADAVGGVTRSMSREAVFTEPMRDEHLSVEPKSVEAAHTDLAGFAEAVAGGDMDARLIWPKG